MADQVTVSTFLELKDNMSKGLKRLEALLRGIESAAGGAKGAVDSFNKSARAAAAGIRMQRAATSEIDRQVRLAQRQKEQAEARGARAMRLAAERYAAFSQRQAAKAAAAQERDAARQARIEAQKQRVEAKGVAFAAREASRKARAEAKATEFAAREAQRRRSMQDKAALDSIRAVAREQRRIEKETEKARLAAERRVANAQRGVAREAQRIQRGNLRQSRAEAGKRQQQAHFIGLAGAAMFGSGIGGIMAAYIGGGAAAAGPLAAILGLEMAINAVKKAAVAAYDAVKSFVVKTFEVGTEYQNQVRVVTSTLRAMNVAPTFAIAKDQASKYYNTIEQLATRLPGETEEYITVFGRGLQQAIANGEKDLNRFAEVSSKFTAIAIDRGISGGAQQAARDIDRMMRGRVTSMTFMFGQLRPVMEQMLGKSVSVETWNKMLPTERLKLFYATVENGLKDVNETSKDSLALVGTMNSLVTKIFRVGGQPLFESTLSIVMRINKFLTDNNDRIMAAVSLISTRLGNVLEGAAIKILKIAENFESVYEKVTSIGFALADWASHVSPFFWMIRKIGSWLGGMIADFERIGIEAASQRRREKQAEYYKQASEALADPKVQAWMKSMPRTNMALALQETGVTQQNEKTIKRWAAAGLKAGISKEKWTAALMEAPGIQAHPEKIAEWYAGMSPRSLGVSDYDKTPSDRTQTINDFRFSRFDIKQEFAEGFDPDRIAVAFSTDLARLGEFKMRASTSPAVTQ